MVIIKQIKYTERLETGNNVTKVGNPNIQLQQRTCGHVLCLWKSLVSCIFMRISAPLMGFSPFSDVVFFLFLLPLAILWNTLCCDHLSTAKRFLVPTRKIARALQR